MRVNVYAEEMTDRIQIISKEIEGQKFTGLRFYLELPATVNGQQYQGPFMHHPGDDDSGAVTFWGKQDLRKALYLAIQQLDEHYGNTLRPCAGIPPQVFTGSQEFQGYGYTTSRGTTVAVQRCVGGDAIRVSAYNPANDETDRSSELFFSAEAATALYDLLDLVLPKAPQQIYDTIFDERPVNTEHRFFEPIWQAIKGWDIQRSEGAGYAGATGTDVQIIIDSLKLDESDGVMRIALERARQVKDEGYTLKEDRTYTWPALARAASCYAMQASLDSGGRASTRESAPSRWPFGREWWKPGKDDTNASKIRELEKAGALIAAEIDRLMALEG